MGEVSSLLVNWKKKDVKGGNKRFKREAEDDGFNVCSDVVKNLGVGQGK